MDIDELMSHCAKLSADLKYGHYMGGSMQPRGHSLPSMAIPIALMFPDNTVADILEIMVRLEQEYFDEKRKG